MFEIREITNEAEYSPLLISKQTPFTQAWLYGEWQKMAGRKVRRFEIIKGSEARGFFQIIKYHLIFSKNFLYIPHGPILRQGCEGQANFFKVLRAKLIKIAKEENAIFVRFDPFPKTENNLEKIFKKVPNYAYHSSYFQPKFEWLLDLTKSEKEILSAMHPKTRYNIGLASRRGVKIEIISENFKEYFSDFYRLIEGTAERGGFNLHPKSYYQNVFKTLTSDKAFLAVAKYGGKILLVNLILLFGNSAFFLFGGSSDEHKNLMFSHLAQWEAIREVKNRRFEVYNFGGVDNGGNYKKFGGFSIFKKRFGGELLKHSNSYDLVLKSFWYKLYGFAKSIRQTL